MKKAFSILCTVVFMIMSLIQPTRAEEIEVVQVFANFEDQVREVEKGTDLSALNLPESLQVQEEQDGECFDLEVTWAGELDLSTVGEYPLYAVLVLNKYVLEPTPQILVRVVETSEEELQSACQLEESASDEEAMSEKTTEEEEFIEEEAGIQLLSLELVDGVYEVHSMDELKEAFAAEEAEIHVQFSSDFSINENLSVPEGKTVVLSGTGVTIKPEKGLTMFSVPETGVLKIEEGITFDLDQKNVCVADSRGTVVVEGGTYINCRLNDQRKGIIAVHGTEGKLVVDGGTFKDNLIQSAWAGVLFIEDQADAKINGGIISGNVIDNQWSAPLCFFNGNGTINDILIENNEADDLTAAGAILVSAMKGDATEAEHNTSNVLMNDGTLRNNRSNRGGAVYVVGGGLAYSDLWSTATFTLSGGEISGNSVSANNDTEGAGGGLYVEWGGSVLMTGGLIEGNTAKGGKGGGVATADGFTTIFGTSPYSTAPDGYNGRKYKDWSTFYPAGFKMTGGTIRGNTATASSVLGDGGCGGGIYISSNKVRLEGGLIEDNHAEHQGGGVYVGSVPYELQILDAVITENHADVLGGGVWLCPTGTIGNYVNNGGAVFDNTSDGAGDDIVTVRTGKDATATLSDRVLGGGKVTWFLDGAVNSDHNLGLAVEDAARYGSSSGVYEPKSNDKNALALHAVVEEEGKEQALALAKVVIRNNSSLRGGGIGSNGGVRIGKSYEAPIEVSVVKKFEGERVLPDSVTVYLLANGHRVDSMILNEENGWSGTWKGLPSIDVKYTVEEEPIEGWTPSVVKKIAVTGNHSFTVTNTATKSRSIEASVLLKAEKYLDQKEPSATYSFELLNEEGTVVQTVQNAGKDITFETLKFDAAGTYKYQVREVVGNDAGIVYDTTVYDVIVSVDSEGKTQVEIRKNGTQVQSLRFDNTSKPKESKPTPTPTPPTPTPSVPPYTPKTGRPYTPNTGDSMLKYALLFTASLAGMILVGKKKR